MGLGAKYGHANYANLFSIVLDFLRIYFIL